MMTYRCSASAASAPTIDTRMTTSSVGSVPSAAEAMCAAAAPIPAPSSATPAKYATIRMSAPTIPPASHVRIIQSVWSAGMNELASSAPMMNP